MRNLLIVLATLCAFGVNSNVFAANTKAVAKTQKVSVQSSGESDGAESSQAAEKRQAIEDVNSLIIDSYRARLDRTLTELYDNIQVATKWDENAQIKILTKVRSDLDDKLDALADAEVSENRKKILLGVYFYLKSSIEGHIKELNFSLQK